MSADELRVENVSLVGVGKKVREIDKMLSAGLTDWVGLAEVWAKSVQVPPHQWAIVWNHASRPQTRVLPAPQTPFPHSSHAWTPVLYYTTRFG